MRIGVDLLPLQSPGSRDRGVGRLATALLQHLAAQPDPAELVLLRHASYPAPADLPDAPIHLVDAPPSQNRHGHHPELQRLVDRNPLSLDAYLNLNPFEACPGHDLPRRPLRGVRMVAFVHDLIPFSDQERYLSNPDDASWFRDRARTVHGYDLLLTNSGATREEVVRGLGLPRSRVVAVGAGAEPDRFHPGSSPDRIEDVHHLRSLGLRDPFFFHLAGSDDRKNTAGLIEAFSQLAPDIRRKHLLVIAGDLRDDFRRGLERLARLLRVDDRLRWLGRVHERVLVACYRHGVAFLHVSHEEGFGLPLLEAMACGAPVVSGDCNAQREVAEGAGVVVHATDHPAITAALHRLATDPTYRASLLRGSLARASEHSWPAAARRAREAIDGIVHHRSSLARSAVEPPRALAMFSPYPPKASGISDHAARLADALAGTYRMDLFHDEDYVPTLQYRRPALACHDHRVAPRRRAIRGHDAVIYHMGNSWYHKFIYETLTRDPGIVVLHDLSLANFHYWYGSLAGSPPDHFARELLADAPDLAGTSAIDVLGASGESGGPAAAASRLGLYLNRRVLEAADAVVVHSPWCADEIARRSPDLADRVTVIPLGAEPIQFEPGTRERTRSRLGWPAEALLIGCFGILTRNKMDDELLEAFGQVAGERPDAILLFVGQDWEDGAARRAARRLGLESRVRFLGRVDAADYRDLLGTVDLAIGLRRPPTFGETSASVLDCLRAGLPTIVNDAGTLRDLPEDVVWRVRWEAEGVDGLVRAMLSLGGDPARRVSLGAAAREHVRGRHGWSEVARRYETLIEERRRRSRRSA